MKQKLNKFQTMNTLPSKVQKNQFNLKCFIEEINSSEKLFLGFVSEGSSQILLFNLKVYTFYRYLVFQNQDLQNELLVFSIIHQEKLTKLILDFKHSPKNLRKKLFHYLFNNIQNFSGIGHTTKYRIYKNLICCRFKKLLVKFTFVAILTLTIAGLICPITVANARNFEKSSDNITPIERFISNPEIVLGDEKYSMRTKNHDLIKRGMERVEKIKQHKANRVKYFKDLMKEDPNVRVIRTIIIYVDSDSVVHILRYIRENETEIGIKPISNLIN
jgi:hypothetical protein